MLPGRIDGATKRLRMPEETKVKGGSLVVRDEDHGQFHTMTSAWFPNPDEIARLMAGAPIYLAVVGNSHPIVSLNVGPTPQDEILIIPGQI
jgi:hypothetical protein